ncbi:MAG: precorrin-2 dehydrogenase/sirohydrochlorin ferrochelatase family protein [Cyclobacteriaceae bacterium]
MEGNTLFPVFLKLDQLRTLVVGGGAVGLEKLRAILKNSPKAKIKLVATQVKPEIHELARLHSRVSIEERAFQISDLLGIDILVLATDIWETNLVIRYLAKKKGILTNVADTPELCDFYLGSTVGKGNLKIGISTNGQSPTFAKRFRQVLEQVLPDETDELLGNLKAIRDSLKGNFGHKVEKLNQYTASLVEGFKTKEEVS